MARTATIIGQAIDVWGDAWDVRERRPTDYGFAVEMGWPAGAARGRGGAGGPRVIVTQALMDRLHMQRHTPYLRGLPIGNTAIKRLRRLLGLNWPADNAKWWEDQVGDLSDLTIEQFAARHGLSYGAIVNARHALLGRQLRPAGWWQAPDVAALLTSPRPRAEIADMLDISVGAVGRLRWQLSSDGAQAVPPP